MAAFFLFQDRLREKIESPFHKGLTFFLFVIRMPTVFAVYMYTVCKRQEKTRQAGIFIQKERYHE